MEMAQFQIVASNLGKLVGIRVSSGNKSRDDRSALVGDVVAVRMWNFLDEAMGSKHAKRPAKLA